VEEQDNKLILAMTELCNSLRSDVIKMCEKMDAKIDSVAKKADAVVATSMGMQNDMRRRDNYTEDNLAEQTAADRARSDSVDPAAFASLSRSVGELTKKMTRTSVDRNAVADLQAKADVAMRVHGDRAEPPMPGESTIDYSIRLARKMQPHSKAWKKVDLNLIAADQLALNNAIEQIRADCYAAGESTEGMQPFQHREITEVGPGGHRITRFVGNGSIFRQLSRPVRHVSYIGVRNTSQL
jgi:hypothetical protein